MKDWKKSLTSGKEKPPIAGLRKDKGVRSPTNELNETKSRSNQLEKKHKKGEDIMGMEEDFKLFAKEQERFNKSLGTFIEGLSKREEQQRDDHHIQEQIAGVIGPLEKKISGQGKGLKELQEKLEPFGQFCTTVEECKAKLKKFEEKAKETPAEEAKQKTLDEFTAQEKYNSIRDGAPQAVQDLDNIYVDKFAENPEYRKLALEKLSPETFVELVKNKEIDDKLTGMCQDEACRIDIVKRLKEVEKSTGKKLF